MNVLFHFLFNYFVLLFLIPEAKEYVLLIFLFSFILDLDHLPYIIRNFRSVKKKPFKIYPPSIKSRLHELYGLVFFTVLFVLLLFVFKEHAILILIAYMCLILHILVDFLTVRTRIFYPFSKKEFLLIKSKNGMKYFEIAGTIILLAAFLISMFYL